VSAGECRRRQGKSEFTLVGDTANVAARVEQLTKSTGDTMLLTQQLRDADTRAATGLMDSNA
jgi:adenylate cyclase